MQTRIDAEAKCWQDLARNQRDRSGDRRELELNGGCGSACKGNDMLGHEKIGSGARGVIVLNDWLCDTSTWDCARPYLDLSRFTWVFADLRGYGRSRDHAGEHTLLEAAADVIELADALRWHKFSLVSHSMSTLVAMHLAQHRPERIERAALLTPAPPTGFGVSDATLAVMQADTRGDDATRCATWQRAWGDRLGEGWIQFKVARWRACSDLDAVVDYIRMYAQTGLPDPQAPIRAPVLALTGGKDMETMRSEMVARLLSPLCAQLTVRSIADCGHYPMQEAPPRTVAIVERFLAG